MVHWALWLRVMQVANEHKVRQRVEGADNQLSRAESRQFVNKRDSREIPPHCDDIQDK